MSKGVNKVIIIGNLGQDPETRAFPDGGTVTNVSIATSESWKDKQTGQKQERTEWHRVVFRNKLAEIAAQYLKKGSKVYIEGSLRTRKWTNQQGQDQYTTEIAANQMQMLDSRNDNAAPAYQASAQQAPMQQAPQQALAGQFPPGYGGATQQQAPQPAAVGFDDDIPW